MNKSYVSRLVRLAFLTPDIITAILEGRQPVTLTANKLMANTRLPINWVEQRRARVQLVPRHSGRPSPPISFHKTNQAAGVETPSQC